MSYLFEVVQHIVDAVGVNAALVQLGTNFREHLVCERVRDRKSVKKSFGISQGSRGVALSEKIKTATRARCKCSERSLCEPRASVREKHHFRNRKVRANTIHMSNHAHRQ